MEGEENKLTTFSTWTIMLGCNESNIIFQQHLCKLGQLRRSNGRNSQVHSQAMKKRPTGHYKKYSHFKGRDTAPTTSSREGSCIVDSSTSVERTLLACARTARAILSRDQSHLRVYTPLSCIVNLATQRVCLVVSGNSCSGGSGRGTS